MHEFVSHHHMLAVALYFSVIFVGNIPVGHLRNRYRRLSRPWARCLYIPLTISILLRHFLEISAYAIPFVIVAVIAGQFIGARLNFGDEGGVEPEAEA
ncbi:MAG: hypothetical protein OEV28_00605 [Nitrospirota bacterium]|nr:hypothetical protein [Nitrospirota bacterium]